MLQLFGKSYISQHCIQEIERKQKEKAWLNYIADALWCQGQNKALTQRFSEIIKPVEREVSSEEVINNLKTKWIAAGGAV